MNIGYRILTLILITILSGCASSPGTSEKDLQKLQEQDVARVVARTSGLSFFTIGSQFDLGIKEVDGTNVQVNKHGDIQDKIDITLPPGKHTLGIDCHADVTQSMDTGPTTETMADVDLAAGHVYEVSTKGFNPDTRACAGIVTDITDTIGQSQGR